MSDLYELKLSILDGKGGFPKLAKRESQIITKNDVNVWNLYMLSNDDTNKIFMKCMEILFCVAQIDALDGKCLRNHLLYTTRFEIYFFC